MQGYVRKRTPFLLDTVARCNGVPFCFHPCRHFHLGRLPRIPLHRSRNLEHRDLRRDRYVALAIVATMAEWSLTPETRRTADAIYAGVVKSPSTILFSISFRFPSFTARCRLRSRLVT